MASHLLVAYDAECPFCCSLVDWVRNRDKRGLIVLFPIQNPELLRMAPELGGLPLHECIHGIDTATRRVFAAGDLWLQLARRLPRWRLLGNLLSAPGMSDLARYVYRRRSEKRCKHRPEWR